MNRNRLFTTRLSILLLSVLSFWPSYARAEADCEGHVFNLTGNDHEKETFDVPDLDLGQSHHGYNRDGQELLATCTERGLRLDIDGKQILTFSDNMVQIGEGDGKGVTVYTQGEGEDDTRFVMVSGEGEDSHTFTMKFDDEGDVRMWGTDEHGDRQIVKIQTGTEIDEEGGISTTRILVSGEDEEGSSHRTVTIEVHEDGEDDVDEDGDDRR